MIQCVLLEILIRTLQWNIFVRKLLKNHMLVLFSLVWCSVKKLWEKKRAIGVSLFFVA